MRSQNTIHLSTELSENIEPALCTLADKIIENDEYSPIVNTPDSAHFIEEKDGLLADFVASPSYQRLSEEEKNSVIRAIDAFAGDNPSWVVEGEPSGENLLGYREHVRRVPAPSGDIVLVSGATLMDIDRVDPGFWDANPEASAQRLASASIIGALVLTRSTRGQMDDGANTFTFSNSPFINTQVTLGGDIHGDFRIAQHEQYPQGSLMPHGVKVPFAPNGNGRMAGAYHSTETELLGCLLMHMDAAGLPDTEQKELITDAMKLFMETEQETPSLFEGNFADYGSSTDLGFIAYQMEDYFIACNQGEGADTITWTELLVLPQSKARMRVMTINDKFVLQNGRKDEDGKFTSEALPIEIPLDQVGQFMKALLYQTAQGAGRTSPVSLLRLLDKRLSFKN